MIEKWYKFFMGVEYEAPHLFLDEHEFYGVDWYNDLDDGRRVNNWNTACFMRSSGQEWDGPAPDIAENSCHLPIFSARFREALDRAGVARGEVQYLPIRVFLSTGEEVKGYAIANILARVAALDFERSKTYNSEGDLVFLAKETEIDARTRKPSASGLVKAVLRKKPLVGHDIVRLDEHSAWILVSERFAKVYRDLRCNAGTKLVPLEVVD